MDKFPIDIPKDNIKEETFFKKETAPYLTENVFRELKSACAEVLIDKGSLIDASKDWWPRSLRWIKDGILPAVPEAVAKPASKDEVKELLKIANKYQIPITPQAGKSGVCGGAVPVRGGICIDLTNLSGMIDIDTSSMTASFYSGTYGPTIKEELDKYNLELGHYPQSFEISTLGGWLACRSAGQFSNKYGKIEDMVLSLDVILANGDEFQVGNKCSRGATGPDLLSLFVGSEGTLGIITNATLKLSPKAPYQKKCAYAFKSFSGALQAIKSTIQSKANIAVLRVYDEKESTRNFNIDSNVLIALDEGEYELVEANFKVLEKYLNNCEKIGTEPVDKWLETRNDVSQLGKLVNLGVVVDTVEITAPFSNIERIYSDIIEGLEALEETVNASVHGSHFYPEGGCLYFTFAGLIKDGNDWGDKYYLTCWDKIMEVSLKYFARISHHHGIGMVRAKYFPTYLGNTHLLLRSIKSTLDPNNILNPGKLAL